MDKEEFDKLREESCVEVDDPLASAPGVLLSNQIEHYAINHKMIIPTFGRVL